MNLKQVGALVSIILATVVITSTIHSVFVTPSVLQAAHESFVSRQEFRMLQGSIDRLEKHLNARLDRIEDKIDD